MKKIKVIGGGLAGPEAALQAAALGCEVTLYEMRPHRSTEAHETASFAELVCSNSLKSESEFSAPWLLKQEMRQAGSFLLAAADACAGSTVAIKKTHTKNEIQAPDSFFQDTIVESRFLFLYTYCHLQKGINYLCRLQGLLADISGIMPSAAISQLQTVMFGNNVPMADTVAPAYRIAAAFTVEKVYDLPYGLVQWMSSNLKVFALK